MLPALAFVAVAAAASWLIDGDARWSRRVAAPPAFADVQAEASCEAEPFRLPGGRKLGEVPTALPGAAIARGRVCGPTRLVAWVEAGDRAHVVVSWRGEVLWEALGDGPHPLDVEVRGAGWVAIASLTPPATSILATGGGEVWISGFSAATSP